jgi:hemolysin activation/secretion protein
MPRVLRSLRGVLISFGLLMAGTASSADTAPAAAPTPAPVQPAAQQQFDVLEYRVLGNTVLAARDIERLLYPLLGPAKTLTDVEAARTALEKLYHDNGFATVYVDIPPQNVTEGVVRLRATEGRLERADIGGARYFSERELRVQLPAATTGSVLKIPDLQRQLGEVNKQTADRQVVPILKAGSAPGTVDLALQVHDELPLHGSLELNNQATIDTRPLRAIAALSYDDLWGRLDKIAFQYQATPQQLGQVRVIAANYVVHKADSGLQPSFLYISSNSNVATVGALGILGKGEIYGAQLAYFVNPESSGVQTVTLGVDYKHFRNTINQNAVTTLDTPISYVNLSLAYAGGWRSERLFTAVSFSADAGPRAIANNPTAFANDRFKARSNYFYVRGDASTYVKLPADFTVHLRLAGQEAVEPVIANENFSIAGSDGVRGYLESEELGDSALKGTVQLQSPGLHWHDRQLGDAFVFYDAGRTEVISALAGQLSHTNLHSWGGGFDILPGQKVTASVTYARALSAGSATRAGDSRVLFVLHGGF